MVISNKFKRFLANKKKFKSIPNRKLKPTSKRRIIRERDPFDFINREVESHRRITQSFPALDQGIRDTFVSSESTLIGLENEALLVEEASENAIPDEI